MYKTFSRTGSGWEIANDLEAPLARQWRIKHEEWGTFYFPSHELARDEAFRIAFENMRETVKNPRIRLPDGNHRLLR